MSYHIRAIEISIRHPVQHVPKRVASLVRTFIITNNSISLKDVTRGGLLSQVMKSFSKEFFDLNISGR